MKGKHNPLKHNLNTILIKFSKRIKTENSTIISSIRYGNLKNVNNKCQTENR